MSDERKLQDPWLLAVWPGMGQVAMTAGYYLLAKLGMYLLAEMSSRQLFDIEHIEVKDGLIHAGRMPRSRLFVWEDPNGKHDLLLFIGEAQVPQGKYAFCKQLIDKAKSLGAVRVFTFAAMATQMNPRSESRVFGVTTDAGGLAEFQQLEVPLMDDGHIGGLNGILLGVAADEGIRGTGLLGEIPHIFAQFPCPAASLAVLRVFTTLAGIDLDCTELQRQADTLAEQLGQLLMQLQERMVRNAEQETDEASTTSTNEDRPIRADEVARLDAMFEQAKQDRSRAYELKNELDRLGLFKEYENRFLDLFRP
jgi:proteasome assembly chaperone (PAC2) family protein